MSAPTYVQHDRQLSGGTATTTLTLAGVTSGNAIIVLVAQYNTAARTYTVSDDAANTYTEAEWLAPSIRAGIWYAHNVTGGSLTITVLGSGTATTEVVAIEVTPLDGTSPLDAHDNFFNSLVTTHYFADVGEIDTSANVFVACVAVTSGSSTLSYGSGWTSITGDSTSLVYMYKSSADALADERGEFGTSISRNSVACIAAFLGASAAAPDRRLRPALATPFMTRPHTRRDAM